MSEPIIALIPRCVQGFGRDAYAGEFESFCELLREYLAAPQEDTAGELLQYAESLTVRRFGASARLFDMRCFLCVYLCPAALELGEAGLAEAVCSRWSARFPRYAFELGRYEDIVSGFRTKPFGFS